MPRDKQAEGKCAYCGGEIPKSGGNKHLSGCPARRAIIEKAERKKVGSEMLYHLRVEGAWQKEFWLDLEMCGSGTLGDLDKYLRAIWLECCGHMSRFSVGGWGSKEIPKRRTAEEVFQPGIKLTHIYDFGTSSETLIKVVGLRDGHPTTPHPMTLMARNLMPEAKCIDCGQPAEWLCMECVIEEEVWGTLCARHVEVHPHDNYDEPVQLVNSPRLGMCGYVGPAEPPY